MKNNSQFSAFYPTVLYPEHEQTAIQRKMSGDLQKIVKTLSLPGVKSKESQTLIVQKSGEEISSVAAFANQMRETLYDGFEKTNSNLESLASCLEWNIGLLHESMGQQITLLQQITQQQQTPVELQAKEYLTSGSEMAGILAENLQSHRLNIDRAKSLFNAANLRFEKALELLPSNKLVYSILISQAELCLLLKRYDEAIQFLSESITYAPKELNADFIGYSYRLLGRIAYIKGEKVKAFTYLYHATKNSPNYAIAWYDMSQYMVGLTGIQGFSAIKCLRKAIEIDPRFLVMAELESNFDPIRGEINKIVRDNMNQLRQKYLSRCSSLIPILQEIGRLYRNFEQTRKLADEAAPWVRSSVEQDRNKLNIVSRYTGYRMENLTNLNNRVRTSNSRTQFESLKVEIDQLETNCRNDLATLQAQWGFWRGLVRDSNWAIKTANMNIRFGQSRWAECQNDLIQHDRKKPILSRKAQRYSGLERIQIQNLYIDSYDSTETKWKIKEELIARIQWEEDRQKILDIMKYCENNCQSERNRIAHVGQFLRQFELLNKS